MSSFRKNYSIRVWNESCLFGDTAEVHILYMAAGSCTVQLQDRMIPLSRGEAFIINFHQQADAELSHDGLLAVISLEYFSLCQLAGVTRVRFTLSNQDPEGKSYQQLKRRVEGLLLAYTGGGTGQIFEELGDYYAMVHLLFQHFLEPETESQSTSRVGQLLDILQESEDLSLQELAARMYLSPAAVSRLFHKTMGENFSQYKKRVRLERVKDELLSGQKSVTAIAMEAGFTSSTVFNRDFKETFGVTPSQYRKEYQHPVNQQQSGDTTLRQVQQLLEEKRASEAEKNPVHRVEADFRNRTFWEPDRSRVLTVGPAHLLQGANMQNQVLFLTQRLNIEYLRLWSLFSEQMLQGDGVGDTFHFSNLDSVLDFCVDHKLKLHFDLAPRRDFSRASEAREIYSRTSSRPQNWFLVLDKFLQHIRRRYTEEVAGSWIYEFSFFLNDHPYSDEEGVTFIDIWKRGYTLVKSILPRARVAGPGHICGNHEESDRLIRKFMSYNCPPDIFTSVNYSYYYSGSLEDEPIFMKKLQKVDDRNFLVGQVRSIRRLLSEYGFPGEYWVTDWGISFGNRNYIQDSCFRASAILDSLLKAQEFADSFNIFSASDLLSAYGDTGNVLSGSGGILSQTGICKPAYYAYQFLRQLGKYRLCETEHCVITGEREESIQILCYNYKALGPKYFLLEEDAHRPDNLDSLFVDLEPLEMEIHLTNLPERPGPYYIRQRILNEKQGGALGKWVRLGCILNLSRDDLEFLERTSVPDVVLEQCEAVNQELTLRFAMEPNELRLIIIS